MKIEKEAEIILEKFSKALEDIPDLEETHYMVDNVNLSREDAARDKNRTKFSEIPISMRKETLWLKKENG